MAMFKFFPRRICRWKFVKGPAGPSLYVTGYLRPALRCHVTLVVQTYWLIGRLVEKLVYAQRAGGLCLVTGGSCGLKGGDCKVDALQEGRFARVVASDKHRHIGEGDLDPLDALKLIDFDCRDFHAMWRAGRTRLGRVLCIELTAELARTSYHTAPRMTRNSCATVHRRQR